MSKKEEQYDVIIVGSGFTGATLAFNLAIAGKKVIVFEKKKKEEIGRNQQQYVDINTYNSSKFLQTYKKAKKVTRKVFFSFSDLSQIFPLPKRDYVKFNLQEYVNFMVDSAAKSGAKFSFDTEITDPVGRGQWVIGVKTKDGKIINGRIIVDCSGVERILTKNIEILDLNTKISSKKYVETFYSQNKIEQKEKLLNEIELENNAFYYFFDREFYSRIEKENKTISFFTVLNKKLTKRKAKAVTNEIINKSKGINISPIISYSDKSVARRPITLAWYGFLSIGEAAFQINPFNIEGSGPALIALSIISKVLLEALQRREASIYRLWNYHTEFFKLVGKHLAALEAFRTHILSFEKDKLLFLFKRGLISKTEINRILDNKYPKPTVLDFLMKFFKGLSDIKTTYIFLNGLRKINYIFNHYSKIPEEYAPKPYHDWYIKQLYLFKVFEEFCQK
ncbi:MAG: NAD(P)/FAD-dependent oxidoreductase [Candidatus Heimdallarchaeum endolithica]|uniref:NAD(P)/FAD-dependent oxidoreductase n=1 Tax=Candidatus Heimdallarchaeum endolithica TaxID=2876572 RepID=A0A9Y1FNZ5_9ARCH|nr:MAG: NAD(P)/FAD-dependent oxidoreductase [Candidatus Heimdallarchaeum endolithica]